MYLWYNFCSLFVFKDFFLPSLSPSKLFKHTRRSPWKNTTDEAASHLTCAASSFAKSVFLYYRGLSSSRKRISWFDYLYRKESPDTGSSDETGLPTRRKTPVVDKREPGLHCKETKLLSSISVIPYGRGFPLSLLMISVNAFKCFLYFTILLKENRKFS